MEKQIIPAINENSFEEVETKLQLLSSAFKDSSEGPEWVQIDVADGTFTEDVRWNDPVDLSGIDTELQVELHLMLNDIDSRIEEWFSPFVHRIIFHLEASDQPSETIRKIKEKGLQVGIAIKPGGRSEEFEPYLKDVDLVQFLAVTPGKSGAKMNEETLDAISDFSVRYPLVPIQIDGGITAENIEEAHAAGASLIVAGSAIFGEKDMIKAYSNLYAAIDD